MFGKKATSAAIDRPAAGTGTGLTATSIYVDLVAGLKQQVSDLRRDKTVAWGVTGLLLLAFLIAGPLRQKIPYFIEVDSSTGRVGLSNRIAEKLTVSDKTQAYFLGLWTARVVTINAATLKDGLPSAYRWTRGGAQTELDEWTEKTDKTAERIGKTPGLTRELLGRPSVAFNEDKNIAFVDFSWIEKVNGVEKERKRKLLTIEFGMVMPKVNEEPDDQDNPLGIAITHFTINDQVSK
jgi:type IV secretory pathway component VirB8